MAESRHPARRLRWRRDKIASTKFPIAVRLSSGFLAIILLTAVIVALAIRTLSTLGSISEELTELHLPEVHLLWEARTLLTEIDADIQHYLHDGDGEGFLYHIEENTKGVAQLLQAHRDLQQRHARRSASEQRLITELAQSYRALALATTEVVDRTRQAGREKAAPLTSPIAAKRNRLHKATMGSLTRLLAFEDGEAALRTALVNVQRRSGHRRLIALAAVAILLSVALAVGITSSLTRPISELMAATQLVADGDLEARASVSSRDELGILGARFNEMLDRLRRSSEDQQRFYADVSHELRTPLTIIRGEAEVALRARDGSAADYRQGLETILAVTGQMGLLVDELLFLARSEAGQVQYDMTPVDLGPVLEEVGQQAKGLCTLKELALNLDLRDSAVVWGDEQRLRQLFFVLADNAIKYSKKGGEVLMALAVDADRATVRVTDTGIGIPDDSIPHIFERFYRVEGTLFQRGTPEEGSGLGLSIARSIVAAHQGEITVESRLGAGTTFSVSLPRSAG
ncbi:MAG: sensor histidine kinase [Candidatus Binatia bacterium]